MAGEGSEGAAYQQLAASEVSGGEQRRLAQKKLVAFWLWLSSDTRAKHSPHGSQSMVTSEPSGFPEKSNCTDCLKPEARTDDSSAIALLIR